ncbi:MAG TPA: response regulator transcription factor [Balneolaceae bacterium]|nr:response regulator transcription factor [Balneolaceae bacterium]
MPQSPIHQISVMIVEDDISIREGISELIQSTDGFRFIEAHSSCEELMACIKHPLPDVLLMDIGLRGMTGIEGVRQLKSLYPELTILMLTVYEDNDRIFNSLSAGASGYLLKKMPLEKLLEAIKIAYSGGAPINPTIAKKVLKLFQKVAPAKETYNLTAREKEILEWLVRGLSYKMIAHQLTISVETVRTHIKNIYEKLHVHSKSEAVAKALRNHIV